MPVASSRRSNSVYGSVTQVIKMDCEASANVDDLVRQDQGIDNKVEVATGNQKSYQVIGIIGSKPTPTTCEVILRGVIDTTVMDRGRVYLSSTGTFTITTVQATPYYVQMLGYSFGNGKIHFEPNTTSTFRP